MNPLEQPREPINGQDTPENALPNMEEVVDGVFETLRKHAVPESEFVHFLNRAIQMAQTPGTHPEEAIHQEIHSDPKIIAEAPFTGWRKRREGNA